MASRACDMRLRCCAASRMRDGDVWQWAIKRSRTRTLKGVLKRKRWAPPWEGKSLVRENMCWRLACLRSDCSKQQQKSVLNHFKQNCSTPIEFPSE
jgi:hypothetical protein